MTDQINHALDSLDTEMYLMRLAAVREDFDLVEQHAAKYITLGGDIRRECFLQTHVSGEVR